jgi:hypothetical protein
MSAQTPIRASTQEHLPIETIRDDLIVLKDGSCSLILTTTAINFGLLSEAEQDAIIYAYAGLLNSLSFPIQILIRSQRKDISFYLQLLKKAEVEQKTPLLRDQIRKYRAFVEKIVRENEVLDKKFYIVIPFSSLELGVKSSLGQSIKTRVTLPFPVDYILEKAKMSLYPKRDHLIAHFSRLGLKTRQLNGKEVLELLYHIYNPESIGQKLDLAKNYETSLISPAVEEPQVASQKTIPVAPAAVVKPSAPPPPPMAGKNV